MTCGPGALGRASVNTPTGAIVTLLLLLLLFRTSQCQGIKGGHYNCTPKEEGKRVPVPLVNGIQVTCHCLDGILDNCEMPSCFKGLEGCHYLEASKVGPCPQVCKTCVQNGTRYNSGQTWNDPQDGCTVNECFSGVVTRSKIECPVPMCANPIAIPGQCCPSCARCSRAGLQYVEGETKTDITNPCNTCTCSQGQLTCQRQACPVLPCKEHLVKKVPGQCCPVCSRQHAPLNESFARLRQMCHFKGKVLYLGSQVSPDACTTCTCAALTMQCQRRVCPTLPCAKAEQKTQTGECCPQCVPKPELPLPDALPAIISVPTHCSLDGSDYKNGQTWTDKCRDCSCSNGEIRCSPMKCPRLSCQPNARMIHKEGQCCPQCEEGVCTVFGDPHYKTFDGRIFNFQGSCKYLLAKDCSAGRNSSFSIRITNDARDSFAFSWLRTVTVRLEDVKVSLMQRMKVKVDGKKVSLPYIKLGSLSVMKDGYRVVLRTNTGVRIIWDGVSFLELTVPPQYQNKLCGLCGNFNGNSSDDFHGRRGQKYTEGQRFGDSWRVGGLKACSVLPKDMPHSYEPQCTQSWEKRIQSDRNCNALTSSLFQTCAQTVDIKYFHNACKLDMCECPGDTCHCEVLTAYARECERSGILIHNWRAATGCQNVSSFTWKNHVQLYRTNETVLNANRTLSILNEVIYPAPPPPTRVEGCTLANAESCRPKAQTNRNKKPPGQGGSSREKKLKDKKWRKARNRQRRKQLRRQEKRRRKQLRKLKRQRGQRRRRPSSRGGRGQSQKSKSRSRLHLVDHPGAERAAPSASGELRSSEGIHVKSVQSPRGPRLSWGTRLGQQSRPPFEALLTSDAARAAEKEAAPPTPDGWEEEADSYQKEDSPDGILKDSYLSGNWSSLITAHQQEALTGNRFLARTPLPLFEGLPSSPRQSKAKRMRRHEPKSKQQLDEHANQSQFSWKRTRRRDAI
eukprot:maker-scaffold257_size234952-snap-gene-1.18 protein:Tk12565 transcript:maker-scaffold257_size234952-snap-gene-1.18-mRNA-1 annotation:"bmp-binding endothelial regulator protein"